MNAVTVDHPRRGWCPSVVRPMETGDGLLVRLHPRAARLTAPQAHAVAAAARACGNGLIDLSSRGNLQIRGVRPETHTKVVELLSEAGLDDAVRRRACILSPLAGVDPSEVVDVAGLADKIEAALGFVDDVERLPAKFAIVVDGGGLPLDDVEADVRLAALDADCLAFALAGPEGPIWIGDCALADGPVAVRALASTFCNAILKGNPARRIRDLSAEARDRIGGAAALAPCAPRPARAPGRAVGPMPLSRDTLAVGLGLPFGRLDADLLDRLAAWSVRLGAGELRLSPWRSMFLAGFPSEDGPELLGLAKDAGMIVEEEDPRRVIAACPGAPACARASVTTHADATRLLAEARQFLATRATIHVSGCAKGCARRAASDLTLVGDGGRYGVVIRGDVRQAPTAHMGIEAILQRLRGLDREGTLASLSTERLAHAFAESR
jgi:precorrin-3B synthase